MCEFAEKILEGHRLSGLIVLLEQVLLPTLLKHSGLAEDTKLNFATVERVPVAVLAAYQRNIARDEHAIHALGDVNQDVGQEVGVEVYM
jgi:hypothetical protein